MDDSEVDFHSMQLTDKSIMVHVNTLGPYLVSRVIQECSTSDSWHTFIIGNVETCGRDFILKTVIDFVHPSELLPVSFVKKKRAFFIARNCLEAILKLMSNKLVIPNPANKNEPLRIVIIANHLASGLVKVDLSENITTVLKKRFNVRSNTLDLNKFHADPDLKEFCLLSQPKLMLYVMQFVIELKPVPIKLELKDNCIKTLDPLRLLAPYKTRALDLRNNELATMESLEPLKDFKNLIILKLDGNPLCNLCSAHVYIAKIKQLCPTIQMIDGLTVFHPNGLMVPQKNFLCTFLGGDLVNQFVQRFFTVYDYEDRRKVMDLYHSSAMFSVTCCIVPAQRTSKTPQLSPYLAINRNLNSPTNSFNEKTKFLFQGREKIYKIFSIFPRSFHDPLQFQCDLVRYTVKQAVIIVNGVFREGEKRLAFMRSFVLQCDSGNAYSIINDQLHVYNALNCQIQVSHKYPANVEATYTPFPYYNKQFTELQQAVHDITSLNYEYSRRFLEICGFDLKNVITTFMELYVNRQIPPEAFIEPKKGPLQRPDDKSKPPLPPIVEAKTLVEYGVITPCTTWQLLNNERVSSTLNKRSTTEILELLKNESAPKHAQPKPNANILQNVVLQPTKNQLADPSIITHRSNLPGMSQGSSGATSSGTVHNNLSSSEPVETIIQKLTRFKQQRKLALKKKRAALKINRLQPEQDPQYNPDEYLDLIKQPETLGIGSNKEVTDAFVKQLSASQGLRPPMPFRRKKGNKKKNKGKRGINPNPPMVYVKNQ